MFLETIPARLHVGSISIIMILSSIIVLLVLSGPVYSFAENGGNDIAQYIQFLKDHPEYEYAGLIDLDEDGRDELLIAQYYDPDRSYYDHETMSLVIPSNGELSIYSLHTHYSPIAYDRANHALVGTSGGTDAFVDLLLTIDTNNVYEWKVGHDPGFTPDSQMYYRYTRALYHVLPEKDDFSYNLSDLLYAEPIDEIQASK